MAEDIGIDSIGVLDHLLIRGFGDSQGVWEGWSVLSAVAAVTREIELATIVACTGFRNPALLAKTADAIDEISGGRLVLGIGAGWLASDYEAFGLPFDHRFSRFEEAFTIIRGLLRDGRSDFTGRYYQVRDCELLPRGPRAGGPPLFVGTFGGPRMQRLIAEHADGWNAFLGFGTNRPSDVPPLREKLDAACEEVGRDPTTLERHVAVRLAVPGLAPPEPGSPLTGSREELAETLRQFAHEGVACVQVALSPETPQALEFLGGVLELLDQP